MTDKTLLRLAVAGTALGAGLLTAAPFAGATDDPASPAPRVSVSTGYVTNAGANSAATTPETFRQDGADKYLADDRQSSKPRDARREHIGHRGHRIYDAEVYLTYDDDHDGFYSGVEVTFDADTDQFAADVYARLYLSLEGGPWIEYYTTDVFTIFGTSAGDTYTVETDLLEGYPTGYYDMLIELYEWNDHHHAASFGPLESSSMSVLPLEDVGRELGIVSPPTPPVSQSSGGGGGLGLPGLAALALVTWARRRAATRLVG